MMLPGRCKVLSEPTKPVPSSKVIDWLTANERNLAVDSVIVGERCVGILSHPYGYKRSSRLSFCNPGTDIDDAFPC